MRGGHSLEAGLRTARWPTPACAGAPDRRGSLRGVPRADPRRCGAALISRRLTIRPTGGAPSMRGNPFSIFMWGFLLGQTPAGAGRPARSSPVRPGWWADSRPFGAAADLLDLEAAREGRPPPGRGGHGEWGRHRQSGWQAPSMRGNRVRLAPPCGCAGQTPAHAGQTPAHAGQPRQWSVRPSGPWADPRPCGATPSGLVFCIFSILWMGLGFSSPGAFLSSRLPQVCPRARFSRFRLIRVCPRAGGVVV